MKIETKFDIGQRVFYVVHDSRNVRKKCPVCNDVREITKNGHKYMCMECAGHAVSKLYVKVPFESHYVKSMEVAEISLRPGIRYHNKPNPRAIIDATFVTLPEELAYATEEEAEMEAEERRERASGLARAGLKKLGIEPKDTDLADNKQYRGPL